MNLEQRMKRAIAMHKDDIFLRSELAGLGSEAQVLRALRCLLDTSECALQARTHPWKSG